jgi:uncharacterized phage protein gp47/JayE
MKNVSEIINQFKNNLNLLGSPLATFTNYSNIYIFFRSIATIISQQYNDLDNYYKNSFLSSATGNNLDSRALDYGLFRGEGSYATGYCIVTSSINTILPSGTILNTATNNLQFQTTVESSITNEESYIKIQSNTYTELANLNAGTTLTSPFYPTVKFIVANSKDLSGNFIGGLTGGKSSESDSSFRDRILTQLNDNKGTLTSIYNKLQELGVSKFYIKEHYPVTGYFTVYLDTQDQTLIDNIETELIEVKPIGVAFELKTLKGYFVDLRFIVTLQSLDFAESVSNSIRQICSNYFDTLELGQELYPINLSVLCSNITGLIDIRIVDPADSKLVPTTDTILKLRDINLTINTRG